MILFQGCGFLVIQIDSYIIKKGLYLMLVCYSKVENHFTVLVFIFQAKYYITHSANSIIVHSKKSLCGVLIV